MTENLINLAVPGLGSALALLSKLYAKYSQLKEGEELCKGLHERLVAFANQLKNIASDTYQAEDLLPRLQTLIEEYSETVEKYANESNFVKRAIKSDKFATKIKIYNECLDSIIAMITVNQTVTLVEWRAKYDQDTTSMTSQLNEMNNLQREILRGLRKLPNQIEETVLEAKREMQEVSDDSDSESTPQPLDPVLRAIVNVAEKVFLDGRVVQNPPFWLIAADEVTTSREIDSKGSTKIFMGEWQGVCVAVKKFFVSGENPVFNKHYKVWHTLQHPHVAQLYGAGSDEGVPFFVYEYANRQSLDRYWDQLSQQDIFRLLHQTALGLSYLHKKHIVHGNLSCSKLLVTDQGTVKLFGFGASYVRENDKSNSIKPVTREDFAAPECVGIGPDGVRHSPRFESDVYSFGLTIYEAISKTNPFHGISCDEMREVKRSNQLQKPQAMSSKAWILIQQMCLYDPTKRISLAFVTEQLGQLARGDAPS